MNSDELPTDANDASSPETPNAKFQEAVAALKEPTASVKTLSDTDIDQYLAENATAIEATLATISPDIKPRLAYHLDDIDRNVKFLAQLRTISLAVGVLIERASRQKNWPELVGMSLLSLKIAAISSQEGFVLNVLSGVGFEAQAVGGLTQHRSQFDFELALTTSAALLVHDAERESFESIANRDDHWETVANQAAANRDKAAGRSSKNTAKLWHLATSNTARLLATDLLIRCHQLHFGFYPDTLENLTPLFVSAVPVDSYHAKEFRYQLLENPTPNSSFELYSVGPSGSDFGGIRGTRKQMFDGICDHFLESTEPGAT